MLIFQTQLLVFQNVIVLTDIIFKRYYIKIGFPLKKTYSERRTWKDREVPMSKARRKTSQNIKPADAI